MMKRTAVRVVPAIALLALGVATFVPHLKGQNTGQPSTKNGEWPMYTADLSGSKYSPVDQIGASNFSKLEVAWRFKTDNLGPRPENKLEGTPIMVKGTVYATAGTRRTVVALNGATGEMKWMYALDEGERATRWAPRQLSGRGLSYWTDGRGDERILYVTTGYRLVELNAKTGVPIQSFGTSGVVDLKVGVVIGKDKQLDLEKGEIGLHSTPTVVNDTVIVGSSMFEGLGYRYSTNAKGPVRAFDVKTGKQLWRFNTIPGPGEFGNDTWENGSWEWTGNVGVWTQISVDPTAGPNGMAYLPVETPTIDEYGGNRPGNNLFAESIVAVDLKTGVRKWHYQLVHHPIWNMDIAAAPVLADITVGGRAIKAVAVMGKQAMVYVFDRQTGTPVFPIEERPVATGDVPGEWYSPTQPFPTRPKPYDHQGVTEDALIDFTPELHAEALHIMSRYKLGPIFTPPPLSRREGPLGSFRLSGGTNWPGAAYDPDTHVLYVPSFTSMVPLGLMPPPSKEFSDLPYVVGNAETGVRYISGPGENVGADVPPPARTTTPTTTTEGTATGLNPQGLPFLKPPYGRITAIDLNKGEWLWQIAHGETPDFVRNSPALKGLTIPRTGQSAAVGALVTKTLVIAGDPQATTLPNRPRGAMLRAYDKASGREVGTVYMPAPQSGTPMTYSLNGR